MKKILIGIPTIKYVEVQTFKSIYDLEVPDGYEIHFEIFRSDQVDQVRNLISDWVIKGYDYLFAVDHDITFAPDTLKKLLQHDVDLVCGVYRQRMEPQAIEVYDMNLQRMDYSTLVNRGLIEIGGCGFGCVLVKRQVFAEVGYPQFVYHSALDHAHTFSEDNDFCLKARNKGFRLWCDPSILCGHIGSTTFHVQASSVDPVLARFRELHHMDLLPVETKNYLKFLRDDGTRPTVIYDIGSSVLHWARETMLTWPDAEIIPFEAMTEVEPFYREYGFSNFHLGVLSDEDGKMVKFYQNLYHPGGNSYYQENVEYSPDAEHLFPDESSVFTSTMTLDSVVKEKNMPWADMIKMDVQGAELDILKGADECLRHCKDLIVEGAVVEYNKGAPHINQIVEYLNTKGFYLAYGPIGASPYDGDYHFRKKFS